MLPPTHFTWIRDVLAHIKLERMRFSLKGSLRNFEKTWIPFLDYVKTLTVVPGDGDGDLSGDGDGDLSGDGDGDLSGRSLGKESILFIFYFFYFIFL